MLDLEPSPALKRIGGERELDTLKGRSVGVLVADGSDAKTVKAVTAAVAEAGGRPVIVAPKIGGAKLSDGSILPADGQLAGNPSVLVDAVAVVLSANGTEALVKEAAAVQFVMDAFVHLKAIGATAEAKPRLDKAGVEADEGGDPPRRRLHRGGRQALLEPRAQGSHLGLAGRRAPPCRCSRRLHGAAG